MYFDIALFKMIDLFNNYIVTYLAEISFAPIKPFPSQGYLLTSYHRLNFEI